MEGGGLNLWVGLKNVFFKLKYTYFAVQHSLNPLMIRQHQLHCQMSHSMIYGVSFDVVGIGIQVNLKLGKCNILNIRNILISYQKIICLRKLHRAVYP